MKLTEPNQDKQAALAELTIYLRRVQIVRGLSDLELLEVFNAVGAGLLRQTLHDQTETGIIPMIPVDARGYAKNPKSAIGTSPVPKNLDS